MTTTFSSRLAEKFISKPLQWPLNCYGTGGLATHVVVEVATIRFARPEFWRLPLPDALFNNKECPMQRSICLLAILFFAGRVSADDTEMSENKKPVLPGAEANGFTRLAQFMVDQAGRQANRAGRFSGQHGDPSERQMAGDFARRLWPARNHHGRSRQKGRDSQPRDLETNL